MTQQGSHAELSRRSFVKTAVWNSAAVGLGTTGIAAWSGAECATSGATIPLKIAHRAASMKMVGDVGVFQLARQMPGLSGVELQVAAGQPNLRDWATVRRYKQEAHRWGMMVPSLAGVWDRGVSIRSAGARANLTQTIRAAEMIGAGVLLVAFFGDNAPDMDDETSFAPMVDLLKEVARPAADAGVILGLENSLSPADNARLADLIDTPNVKIYYDVHNMAHYGHRDQAVSGVKLLGKERICMVHVKNEDKLIEELGRIDWRAAFEAFNEIGYSGWYVFESQHRNQCEMVDATTRNIQFLKKVCRMPPAEPAVLRVIRDAAPEGFAALFDGTSLRGWKWHEGLEGRWEAAEGVIRLRADQPRRKRGEDDSLWTEQSYRDFILMADWRLTAEPVLQQMNDFTPDGLIKVDADGQRMLHPVQHAGDSGILLRGDAKAQVNIWSQPMGSGDINPIHKDASLPAEIRRAAMPRVRADKPAGQWNRFVITLRGDQVHVVLNDRTVIERAQIPGVAAEGPIGLQNHGDPIEFRNLFIKSLT